MTRFAASVEQAWQRHDDFTIPAADGADQPCSYAQAFAQQVAELCQVAFRDPSHVSINQALLQVCKKYWEWYYVVPKRHRHHVAGRQHRCIHAEFRYASEQLKRLELSLAPPMLFLPLPPPPPPPRVEETFAGITLGEVLGEEEA